MKKATKNICCIYKVAATTHFHAPFHFCLEEKKQSKLRIHKRYMLYVIHVINEKFKETISHPQPSAHLITNTQAHTCSERETEKERKQEGERDDWAFDLANQPTSPHFYHRKPEHDGLYFITV